MRRVLLGTLGAALLLAAAIEMAHLVVMGCMRPLALEFGVPTM